MRWFQGMKAPARRRMITHVAIIVLAVLLVTVLHYSTAPGLANIHAVYRFFYFLPVVYAALVFGFWGGVTTALAASLLFAPHIFFKWGVFPSDSINDLLVVVALCGVAVITGAATDRMRMAQARYQRTAEQLAASLRRLEEQADELRRAERLSALGTLAGGLAHEIRNPVGIIQASAQLLVMECGPEAEEALAVIHQETERIERLIQDLLNYAGGAPLRREPVDLLSLLQAVRDRMRPVADAQQVDIQVEVAPGMPEALLDPSQMEQALVNLCMNSIQAMEQGGRVGIQALWRAGEELPLEIRVCDTGPGLPAADLHRIFDPFYTTKDRGTGLGLSVVQRIVDDHGGRVWAENGPEGGAVFILRFHALGAVNLG